MTCYILYKDKMIIIIYYYNINLSINYKIVLIIAKINLLKMYLVFIY